MRSIYTWLKGSGGIVQKFLLNCLSDIKKKPKRGAVGLLIALGFGIWFGPSAAILWFIFLIFLVYEWDNRIVGCFAIIALVICPILLSLNENDAAEIVAEWAYFFLVITVILQIIELKRHPDRFEDHDHA